MNDTIKSLFPVLYNNPGLIYLDSGASSLKLKTVIDAISTYYSHYGVNIHRGLYKISEKASIEYENTRNTVAKFINAKPSEIIFTRGTTESLNLIAYSLGRKIISKQDTIVTSIMEHHANFVPWQVLASETQASLLVLDITDDGQLQIVQNNTIIPLESVISKKTKLICLTWVSNVLGTVNPIKKIVKNIKTINKNVIVVLDAAQAIAHIELDVQDLGVDFVAFSGHKMFGPTGVGILWGKNEILADMYPFQYGGDMIEEVFINKSIFKNAPFKFEAGTPDIASVIGLSPAISFIMQVGYKKIKDHEKEIIDYAYNMLIDSFGKKITILGPKPKYRSGAIAFTMQKIHPHDIAQILSDMNIAVRAGHHCAMPVHQRLNVPSSTRASFSIYNSKNDVDMLIKALHKTISLLA